MTKKSFGPYFMTYMTKPLKCMMVMKKTKCYKQLDEMVAELTPAILLPTTPYYVLPHAWVKNYCMSPYNFSMTQYQPLIPAHYEQVS
jgi:hypothetical protein